MNDCKCLNAKTREREVECPRCFGRCDTWIKEGEVTVDGVVGEVGHTDFCPSCNGIGNVIMTYKKCPDCDKREEVVSIRPTK